MLVTARELNHLRDFGLGDFEREHAANAHTMTMDMQHDLDRLLPGSC